MQNQQKSRPRSPYLSQPKPRLGDRSQGFHPFPPSYTPQRQEQQKPAPYFKSITPRRTRTTSSKVVNFYYFNVNSYFTGHESPKNLNEAKSFESRDNKNQKANVLYTSYDMVPGGRVITQSNSTHKAQPSLNNVSNQSIKLNTSTQAPEHRKNFTKYIAAAAKNISYNDLSQQYMSQKQTHYSPSNQNIPPAIPASLRKQLIGTLSCIRPQHNSQASIEGGTGNVVQPRPPLETLKSSTTMYENMKSFIKGHMEGQNVSGKTSFAPTPMENSREVVGSQGGKGSRHVKIVQYRVKKENIVDTSGEERMRQALLKNLVEINNHHSVQTMQDIERKVATEGSEIELVGSQKSLHGYLVERPTVDKEKGKMIRRKIVSPQTMSREVSGVMNNTVDVQSQVLETEGAQNTNASTTQETPRGLFRKKKLLKNLTNAAKKVTGAQNSGNKRCSTSLVRSSVKGKQENERVKSGQAMRKRQDVKVEERVQSSSFALPVVVHHDGAALEKELAIQQGRADVLEGWDPEFNKEGSPCAFDRLEIKHFGSL